uniref:Uncharacterized protein n=1 Tax=Salvator merianae TaxID=96440 RepID=A0A8D0BMD5_SALMN
FLTFHLYKKQCFLAASVSSIYLSRHSCCSPLSALWLASRCFCYYSWSCAIDSVLTCFSSLLGKTFALIQLHFLPYCIGRLGSIAHITLVWRGLSTGLSQTFYSLGILNNTVALDTTVQWA